MDDGIITFDYIFKCWKEKDYPKEFDDLLDDYLKTKADVFSGANVMGVPSWLSKLLVAIEIGVQRDPDRFLKHKEYWKELLGRAWKISIEDKWVEWA